MLCFFPLLFVISEGFPSPLSSGWASYFLLRASGWHKALLSVLVPRRRAAQLGHRSAVRREEVKEVCSRLRSAVYYRPEAVERGYSSRATAQGAAVMDKPARWSWDLGLFRTLPPLKQKKGNTKGASRERVHSTQPMGVAGKWKPEGGKGRPLWRASRTWPSVEKCLGFCVLAQQKQTHPLRIPHPVTGEKSEQRKVYTISSTSVCL